MTVTKRRFYWARCGSGDPEPVEVAAEGGQLVAHTTRGGRHVLSTDGCQMQILGQWGTPMSLDEILADDHRDQIRAPRKRDGLE